MYDGYKQRENRKARYIQWLLAPYSETVPALYEITGFDEEKPVETVNDRETMEKEFEELKRRFAR